MKLPSFAKIPFSVPLAVACGLNARIEEAKEDLKKLYLSLGGSKSSGCYRAGDITALRKEIKGLLEVQFASVFDELFDRNPGLRDYQEEYGLSVYHSIQYNFFGLQSEEPLLSVTLEVAVIYSFYAEFLLELKEERPNIYPLMRTIFHLLDIISPRTSASDFLETMRDNHEMDKSEGYDSEDRDDTLTMAEEEADNYEKHVIHMKGSYPGLVRKIKSLHKKTAWELTDKENWFVATAIELFESWPRWDAKKVDVIHDDSGDRNSMENFFNLMWSTHGAIQDELEVWSQDCGNLSAPCIAFAVKNKRNLEAVKEAIRSFVLLESVMSGGYSIWNTKG
ncbi:MAG: hypothetical protein ACHQ0Y_04925 [Thermodesulfovibrionales bacterium]